jgi:hypothetical protein
MLLLSYRCGAFRSQDLHNEIDNLRSLLDARPTMRQWSEAQRERYVGLLPLWVSLLYLLYCVRFSGRIVQLYGG